MEMSNLKLMIVDDDDTALDTCQSCVDDFKREREIVIELIKCKTLEDSLKQLDASFDGVIIDMKLTTQGSGDEGSTLINEINKTLLRIPVAVLTGTPDVVERKANYIGVYKKGEEGSGYSDLLNQFWDIYATGLTKIMGGRGSIEDCLGHVFNENLMPVQYRKKWIEYGKRDPMRTEKALFRHALSHLLQLLDEDDNSYFPEEVYLVPPVTANIKTGSIVINKENERSYIVITPACDLVVRSDGKRNTNRILVVEIDAQTIVFPDYPPIDLSKEQKKYLEKAYNNNLNYYYHWLPKTGFFEGGFINFRKLSTLEFEEFKTKFKEPLVQISPPFVKDMVARFSAYYARQGQPGIDFSGFIDPVQPPHDES
jgi:CheY-like chemotaxis protein